MGSSAQNSSGAHWCRRRVRLNEVPEKVPGEGLGGLGANPGQVQQGSEENSGEALVQSQVRSNTVPEKVWEALVQSQVRFNRVPDGRLRCRAQVQQGSGEGSGEV